MLDELFQTIFLNIIFIFGVFLLITTLEFEFFSKNRIGNILTGIVIGLTTIITMMNGFRLEAGIVYDARSVVIGVASFFFPLFTSVVSTTIAIVYRISLGGVGVIPGSFSIFSAFLVGVIWRRIAQKHSISKSYYNYYFLGLAIHVFVLLSQLLLPYPRNIEVIRIIGPVFLGIYPFATLILCVFMQNQSDRSLMQNRLIESESRLKTIFNESPIAMLVHDCETGDVIAANKFTFDIFQISSVEELNSLLWLDEPPYSRKEAVEYIQKAKHEDQNFVWKTKVDNNVFYEQVLLRPIILEGNKRILSTSIDITDKKLTEEKIKHASLHDYLTGLPNRRYFDEKIIELDKQENFPLIIAMLDIDGLKLINDTLGHFSGDQAIVEVAKLLDTCFSESSFASRTGGDEFMIVCSKMTLDEFKQRRNMMLKLVSEVKIHDVEISLSIGIAVKDDDQDKMEDIIIKAENDMYANKVLHGQSARNKIIVTLFDALKDKYEEERIHSSRVSHFCALMGEKLNLLESEKQELELAGRMHDIGKISIPDTILRKDGKLSDDEWMIMKTHTTNGYQILRSADQYSRLAEYALTHHERIDGSGYPQGLKGDEIPLFSRIIAICDAFEAMTTDRQYRKSLSSQEAIAEIQRCSGTQFDSQLVEMFVTEVFPLID